MTRRAFVIAALSAIAVGACTAAPSPVSTHNPNEVSYSLAPLSADERPLPTQPPPAYSACGMVGFDATLAGSPTDPRLVWLMAGSSPYGSSGERIDVVWPSGYRVRFSPALEVLDDTDMVRLHGGDRVEGGCVAPGGLYLLEPPFN